eukprot:TRINITY_DN6492_c0_g1_i1.p1 TRINITY_DN6492_c0_g1~~TRINITY_DN6492_c0_g1_i1.p1  ORF type:complete len:124 (+),score=21.96 TRINITY_DN6492_c0_g1_i1:429-800(+)
MTGHSVHSMLKRINVSEWLVEMHRNEYPIHFLNHAHRGTKLHFAERVGILQTLLSGKNAHIEWGDALTNTSYADIDGRLAELGYGITYEKLKKVFPTLDKHVDRISNDFQLMQRLLHLLGAKQ